MYFTPLALLPLFSLATASVLPRSDLGSWHIQYIRRAYANGYQSEESTAVYTSPSYPEGLTRSCGWVHNPDATPVYSSSCDEGYSVEYHGKTVSISQVVQKPSANTTVFGSAPLTLTPNPVGRVFKGETTVEVTSATA